MKKYLSFVLLIATFLSAYTQAGSLNLTFGVGGIATTSFWQGNMRSMAVQSDGKIALAGYHFNGSSNSIALTRFNIDGSLDNTFDGDGNLSTLIGTASEGNAVAIQPDGKIVLAGSSYDNSGSGDDVFLLVRYNTNGSLDNTFDADGIATTTFSGSNGDIANALLIQTDGKIILAASHHNGSRQDFAILRYNSNGSLDNSFDTDGKLTTAIGSSDDIAYSIAMQTDGKIVVAGQSDISGNNDFVLVRYNSNGSLDNSFDTDGKLTISIGFAQDEAALAIQANGNILIAGSNGSNFIAARFNANGSLDNTFDGDGIAITPVGIASSAEATSMEIETDGKILVAGFAFVAPGRDFALVRYNSNGSLDISFDGDGKVTTHIAGNDYAESIKISGSRIYLGGISNNNVFTVVAYQNSSVVPLQLISFSGKNINNKVQLSWVTENEINTSHFDIEKSGDGMLFFKKGETTAVNNSGINKYTFTDDQPLNGLNYYRLRQVDLDGKFTYSPVVRIFTDKGLQQVSVYPNPANEFIYITYAGNKDKITLSIYNVQERLISKQTVKAGSINKIRVHQLAKALYFIELTDGELIQTKKFIKQ